MSEDQFYGRRLLGVEASTESELANLGLLDGFVADLQRWRTVAELSVAWLEDAGYSFYGSALSVVESAAVVELERALGRRLPLCLKLFWEHVGAVDLSGRAEPLPLVVSNRGRLEWEADPFVVYGPHSDPLRRVTTRSRQIPISPDSFGKRLESGAGPFFFESCTTQADPVIFKTEAAIERFSGLVERSMSWAGFPAAFDDCANQPDWVDDLVQHVSERMGLP